MSAWEMLNKYEAPRRIKAKRAPWSTNIPGISGGARQFSQQRKSILMSSDATMFSLAARFSAWFSNDSQVFPMRAV